MSVSVFRGSRSFLKHIQLTSTTPTDIVDKDHYHH